MREQYERALLKRPIRGNLPTFVHIHSYLGGFVLLCKLKREPSERTIRRLQIYISHRAALFGRESCKKVL